MNDLGQILPLWRELENSGVDYVLATVIAVEGSSYRKPGARMLLAQDGRRAGTVSGGCLEAEVARRALWLTANGPVVERYSTVDDEDERPYGSGCGGIVFLLLERRSTAAPLLMALESAFKARIGLAIATVLEGQYIGERANAGANEHDSQEAQRLVAADNGQYGPIAGELKGLARLALENCTSFEQNLLFDGVLTRVLADYLAPRPGLWVFGAGDDAKPLVQLAQTLGWFVAVADGRSHLATRERFSTVDDLRVLPVFDLPETARHDLQLRPTDVAVVMTHSFDQDSRILASLLTLDALPAYLGVLGPQRRTRELLAEAARLLDLPATADRIDRWLAQMHAPTGLDLGADTPAAIALSIVAEIQQALTAATGQPLREVRAIREIPANSCD
ncbi:MAG TPA: XdhC family protein [Terracidiphilus sp.]|jgi:xanthine/CO dehydrogenase XdhC/CoxF family maturation factor|nr:XdhC family protein [Terracidiphilus sp.]